MIKVYIASPYSNGDKEQNVALQLMVFEYLANHGYAPYAPLWSHFQNLVYQRPWEDWMRLDKEWVKMCDCVLRLEGESRGADIEVALAKRKAKPVFYSERELINYYNRWKLTRWILGVYRHLLSIWKRLF